MVRSPPQDGRRAASEGKETARKKAITAGAPRGAAWAATASAAIAQVSTAPQPSATIDEVVVTAQRRAENVQDVPITMNVSAAKQVEQARITEVGEVANRTVGLNFDAFPTSQPRPAIRGIGSSDRGAAGDPSTAVFIDEVYMGRPAAVAF